MNAGTMHGAQPRSTARESAIWTAALFAGLACVAPRWSSAAAQDTASVRVTLDGDRLSISTLGVPRGQLLDRLKKQYGIEVRPYLAADERVRIDVANVPIDSAIALIMPRGSRYAVRFGEREVARGVTTAGPKAGESKARPAGLAPKRPSRLLRGAGPRFKPVPERVVERPVAQGRGMKPAASGSREVPPGRGPKVPAAAAPSGERTIHISFVIRATDRPPAGTVIPRDSVRVARAQLIDGVAAPSAIVRGPFLFAFRGANGGLVHFGSMLDPLEEHSYDTTGVHGETRAREGTFAISVPERILPVQRLGTVQLYLYDARNVSLPASLDAAAFERAAAQARPVATVDGRALVAAFR